MAITSGLAAMAIVDIAWSRFVPLFTFARPSPFLRGVEEARFAGDEIRGGGAKSLVDSALRRELLAMPRAGRSHRYAT